jgi:hypothetical protein
MWLLLLWLWLAISNPSNNAPALESPFFFRQRGIT